MRALHQVNPNNKQYMQCNHCEKVQCSGITWIKHHLEGSARALPWALNAREIFKKCSSKCYKRTTVMVSFRKWRSLVEMEAWYKEWVLGFFCLRNLHAKSKCRMKDETNHHQWNVEELRYDFSGYLPNALCGGTFSQLSKNPSSRRSWSQLSNMIKKFVCQNHIMVLELHSTRIVRELT